MDRSSVKAAVLVKHLGSVSLNLHFYFVLFFHFFRKPNFALLLWISYARGLCTCHDGFPVHFQRLLWKALLNASIPTLVEQVQCTQGTPKRPHPTGLDAPKQKRSNMIQPMGWIWYHVWIHDGNDSCFEGSVVEQFCECYGIFGCIWVHFALISWRFRNSYGTGIFGGWWCLLLRQHGYCRP